MHYTRNRIIVSVRVQLAGSRRRAYIKHTTTATYIERPSVTTAQLFSSRWVTGLREIAADRLFSLFWCIVIFIVRPQVIGQERQAIRMNDSKVRTREREGETKEEEGGKKCGIDVQNNTQDGYLW